MGGIGFGLSICEEIEKLMFAAAFYLLMARVCAACDIALLVVAALTASGRVYRDIHFPFDMAGSLVVGAGERRDDAPACAGRLNPLNAKLILVSALLTGRFVRSKSHDARKG